MRTFLETVAMDLYQRFGTGISNMVFVFPNKRPALYLRKWLGEMIRQPLWSPEMKTIHEFILSSADKLPADKLIQKFLLFEAYEEVFEQTGEPYNNRFEDFFSFGEILLNDFTELESNLAAVTDVYANLSQIETLEKGFEYLTEEQRQYLERFWTSFSTAKMSSQQEKFIRLWNHLPSIYLLFKEKLAARKLINMGSAYRDLADQTHAAIQFDSKYSKIVFIGFNALNQAELKILKHYKENKKALFYFDADRHYLDDDLQEAGRFIRRNILWFGNEIEAVDAINRPEKSIQIIAAEGDAAQVRLVPQLLETINGLRQAPEKTAILLADESQLIPLLHALPEDIAVNITMGFDLKRSLVYSLIRSALDLQLSIEQNRGVAVFYQPLLRFLEHPWLQDHKSAVVLAKKVQANGLIIVPRTILTEIADPLLSEWLKPVNSPLNVFDHLRGILQWWVDEGQQTRQTEIQRQLATACWQQLNRLEGLLQEFSKHLSLPFVAETILSTLGSLSVPLEGEPLEGLQVMGLLESRGLDFDQFILLQVNEGVLPKRSAAPTFLPDSIRRAYQLSVLENQDSIFAYVFYRLLQRANKAWFTFNRTVTDQSTGERSRFLEQLKHETNIDIETLVLSLPLKADWKEPITIMKDETVLRMLNRFSISESKLTPSAINTYLDCRLRFFYQYLARIKEPEQFMEELDPRMVGLILHKTMEMLYLRLARKKGNQEVDPEDFEWLETILQDSVLDLAFSEEISKTPDQPFSFNGSFLVIREIILQYARSILTADKLYAPFTMLEMEARQAIRVQVTTKEKKETIYLGGIIDRVDWKNGVYRIIDYKTGKDEKSFPSIESLFDREQKDRNKAALQTFIYAWVLQQQKGQLLPIETGLYDIRNMQRDKERFNWRFSFKGNKQTETIGYQEHPGYESLIIERLMGVLSEIYDPEIPFDQTSIVEKCSYCPYNMLCGR